MIELTPEKRIEAYRFAIGRISACAGGLWVCPLLCSCSARYGIYENGDEILNYYPEFANKKPPETSIDRYGGWWPHNARGNTARIAALEACIQECELNVVELRD